MNNNPYNTKEKLNIKENSMNIKENSMNNNNYIIKENCMNNNNYIIKENCMNNNNYNIKENEIVGQTPLLKKSYKGSIKPISEKGLDRSCLQAGYLTHLSLIEPYCKLNKFSEKKQKQVLLNLMSDQKGNLLTNIETVHWITEATAYKKGKRYSAKEALENLYSIGLMKFSTDPNYKKGIARESKIKQIKKVSDISVEIISYYIDNDIFNLIDNIYNVYSIKNERIYHEDEIRELFSQSAFQAVMLSQSASKSERFNRAIFTTNLIKKEQNKQGINFRFLNLLSRLLCPGFQKGRRETIFKKLLIKYNINHKYFNPIKENKKNISLVDTLLTEIRKLPVLENEIQKLSVNEIQKLINEIQKLTSKLQTPINKADPRSLARASSGDSFQESNPRSLARASSGDSFQESNPRPLARTQEVEPAINVQEESINTNSSDISTTPPSEITTHRPLASSQEVEPAINVQEESINNNSSNIPTTPPSERFLKRNLSAEETSLELLRDRKRSLELIQSEVPEQHAYKEHKKSLESIKEEQQDASPDLIKEEYDKEITGSDLRNKAIEVLSKNQEYINLTYNEALMYNIIQYNPTDIIDDRQISNMLINGSLPQEYRILSPSSPRVYGKGTDNLFYTRKELRLKVMEGLGFCDVDIQNCHAQITCALWGTEMPTLNACLKEDSLWNYYKELYEAEGKVFYKSLIKTLHHATFLTGGNPAYQKAYKRFNSSSNIKITQNEFDDILKIFKKAEVYKELKSLFKNLKKSWIGKILVCPTGEAFKVEDTNWAIKKSKGINTGNFPTALSAYLQSYEVLLISHLIVSCQELFLPILWQHDGLTIKCLYNNTVELMQEALNRFCNKFLSGRQLKLVETKL